MKEGIPVSSMLFAMPHLDARELEVIDEIGQLKRHLQFQLHEPRRWYGSLRRLSFARNLQGSNSIEGYSAALDDVAAAVDGEEPLEANDETKHALLGYRDAMTYVLQLAGDPGFVYSEQLLKSLHFMMLNRELNKRPGLWRTGPVYVVSEPSGEAVYEGADAAEVPQLVGDLVSRLNIPDSSPPMVRAALAHLNLAMIHPFKDGNGRMSRALQTLVLAREGVLNPTFCSIEEYLGRNTLAYYDVLATVGGGHWQPRRDCRPWVRFCLTAHLRQARAYVRRVRESEQLWEQLEAQVVKSGLPIRAIPALFDAALGLRIRNGTYRALQPDDAKISDGIATNDLNRLVKAGLLIAIGSNRGRFYTGSPVLREIVLKIRCQRDPRDNTDPFRSPPATAPR